MASRRLTPRTKHSKETQITSTRQVIGIVEREFGSNPGRAADIWLPVDRAGALEWLDLFIRERLPRFGIYEDMMAEGELFLFHSVLRDAESWIAQST